MLQCMTNLCSTIPLIFFLSEMVTHITVTGNIVLIILHSTVTCLPWLSLLEAVLLLPCGLRRLLLGSRAGGDSVVLCPPTKWPLFLVLPAVSFGGDDPSSSSSWYMSSWSPWRCIISRDLPGVGLTGFSSSFRLSFCLKDLRLEA